MQGAEHNDSTRTGDAVQRSPNTRELRRGRGQEMIDPEGCSAEAQKVKSHRNHERAADTADDERHPWPQGEAPAEKTQDDTEIGVDKHPAEVVQQMLTVSTSRWQGSRVETHQRSTHAETVRAADEAEKECRNNPPTFDLEREIVGVRCRG